MHITGRVEVLLDGQLLLNKAGAVASGLGISGEPSFEVNPVLGDTGQHGVTETPVPAQVEVTVTDREDVSLSDLAKVRENGTVVFRAANGGKSYTGEGFTCKRNFSITAGEGETPLVFFGPYWTENVQ